MNLSHAVSFSFSLNLPYSAGVDFVRDVEKSLSKASFIQDLEVVNSPDTVVTANLPVNAALFGQQLLMFRSCLHTTPKGARLEALSIDTDKPGWAEVSGEAVVSPLPTGSQVDYTFDITIHLRLPKAEKWGGQALTKMIEFTAQRVLENITASFPSAVQDAAQEVEAAYTT